MSRFEEWVRRHLADENPTLEPASPPQPLPSQRPEDFEDFEDFAADQPVPYTISVTVPNTLQIGPDREQLRDHEPFMSSVSAAARMVEQRFSQAVEDSLAEWTEANGE